MAGKDMLLTLGGILVAFGLGTLAEYWGHIFMHQGRCFSKIHTAHHQDGLGQGWLKEFWAYCCPAVLPIALLVLWLWWIGLLWLGLGAVLGGTLYAAFAAYAHQLQHEFPEMVFWMPQPVHYIHHAHNMWQHNFGIACDIWDRVFGTYKPVEWQPPPWRERPLSRLWQIKWL
jgi:sterol desaturase/sphingolipid hydroxylase (fatty acid hydroxylase superfamily)